VCHQVNFVGQWTAVPSLDTAFTLGGSDNELWTSGYLNIGGGSVRAANHFHSF
jgi:hypothetical protein